MFLVEEWKGLIYGKINYSDFFQISNFGNLKNKRTKHIYSPCCDTQGYLKVSTTINGRNVNLRIHKCVADTFIGFKGDGLEINHKDANKLNNYVSNLEYVTHKENMEHASKMNLLSLNNSGGQNRKLTQEQVLFIRKNYKPYDKTFSRRKLAEMFNVSHDTIDRILNNSTYRDDGCRLEPTVKKPMKSSLRETRS